MPVPFHPIEDGLIADLSSQFPGRDTQIQALITLFDVRSRSKLQDGGSWINLS
jgi:hypothetical protein